MTAVFADTFFFLALINPRDAGHTKAVTVAGVGAGPLVTTAWVLTEVADGLANTPDRHLFAKIITDLEHEPSATIIPPTQELFERGVRLYVARPDKKWSLTDCIS